MLENAITELTAVCRELLQELRARSGNVDVCEATLVEVDPAPAELPPKSEPTPAAVEVSNPAPVEAEQTEVMSAEEFAQRSTVMGSKLKEVFGGLAFKKLQEILTPVGARNLGGVPAELRRDVIAALETAIVEARHDR